MILIILCVLLHIKRVSDFELSFQFVEVKESFQAFQDWVSVFFLEIYRHIKADDLLPGAHAATTEIFNFHFLFCRDSCFFPVYVSICIVSRLFEFSSRNFISFQFFIDFYSHSKTVWSIEKLIDSIINMKIIEFKFS